ncbi:MAG: response regulator [Oscillospiraceae bacterium]
MAYNLLISDDERNIREGILVSCDWKEIGIGEIFMACNGLEALEIFGEHHIDILLSDIVMPEMDGLELCREVHERYGHVLTYILTGYNDFEYARQAMRSNVLDYILKPVEDEELTAAMQQAVQVLDRRGSRMRQIKSIEKELVDSLTDEARKVLHSFVEDAFSDWGSLPAGNANGQPSSANPIIQKTLDYLEDNLSNEQISLTSIAENYLYLNSHYVGKLFKKEMGVKFSTYLLDRRMKHAVYFIETNPGAKVYEIAEAAGFASNTNYFSTLFRKVMGCRPTEYLGK